MKNRFVLVKCDCGGAYEVLRSSSRHRQRLILDYAVCPHCSEPRIASVWHAGDFENRCIDCGIPFRLEPKLGHNRCNTDYVAWYRLTKREPLVMIEIPTLPANGGPETHREGDRHLPHRDSSNL